MLLTFAEFKMPWRRNRYQYRKNACADHWCRIKASANERLERKERQREAEKLMISTDDDALVICIFNYFFIYLLLTK